MSQRWISGVFWASAAYDLVLGGAFLLAGSKVLEHFGVPLPNHLGYIQFPAIILIIFALMFAQIARDPVGRRECIQYGIGLKLAYAGTVLYHHFTTGVPSMWLPFAYIDLVFLIAFIAAWKVTKATAN